MRQYVSLLVVFFFLASTIQLPAKERGASQQSPPYLAVMGIQVDLELPQNIGPAIRDRIYGALNSTKKYSLVDREHIDSIMAEIRNSQSCTAESCAIEAGRQLTAQFIITGRVSKLGPNKCQLSMQMTDVQRAEIVRAVTPTCSCEGSELARMAEGSALDLVGISSTPGKIVIQVTPSSATVYLNGEPMKVISTNGVEVKSGSHSISARAPKYKSEEQTVNVLPGESKTVVFNLKKEKIAGGLFGKWWFWAGVGLIVAGGIAGGIAASGGSKGGGSKTTPATILPSGSTGTGSGTGTLGTSW